MASTENNMEVKHFSGKLSKHFIYKLNAQFAFRGSNMLLTYHLRHKHDDIYINIKTLPRVSGRRVLKINNEFLVVSLQATNFLQT